MDAKTARAVKNQAIRERIAEAQDMRARVRERTSDLLVNDMNRIDRAIADAAVAGRNEIVYTVVLMDMARTYGAEALKLEFKPYLEQVYKTLGYRVKVDIKGSGTHGIGIRIKW